MDSINDLGASQTGTMRQAVCWECGKELLCSEYVVCCTGTIFHICPECEDKVNADGQPESSESTEAK